MIILDYVSSPGLRICRFRVSLEPIKFLEFFSVVRARYTPWPLPKEWEWSTSLPFFLLFPRLQPIAVVLLFIQALSTGSNSKSSLYIYCSFFHSSSQAPCPLFSLFVKNLPRNLLVIRHIWVFSDSASVIPYRPRLR